MVALAALVWGTDSVTSTHTAAHRSLTPGPGHLAPSLAYTGNGHAHGECYKTHTYKKQINLYNFVSTYCSTDSTNIWSLSYRQLGVGTQGKAPSPYSFILLKPPQKNKNTDPPRKVRGYLLQNILLRNGSFRTYLFLIFYLKHPNIYIIHVDDILP